MRWRYGFIDSTGNVIVRLQEEGKPDNFSEGLAAIKTPGGGSWSYIDSSGQIVIPDFSAGNAFEFHNGRAHVRQSTPNNWDPDCENYITTSGEFLLPTWNQTVSDFSEGLAWFSLHPENKYIPRIWSCIDTAGTQVFAPKYMRDSSCSDFSEGLAVVAADYGDVGGPSGTQITSLCFVDALGKVAIPGPFEAASAFDCGRATVQFPDRTLAIIGRSGEVIRKFGKSFLDFGHSAYYGRYTGFKCGLAPVLIRSRWRRRERWGYVDLNGDLVIDPQFETVHKFSEGLAWTTKERMSEEGEYIDTTGRVVISKVKRTLWGTEFWCGLAEVRLPEKNRSCLIDKHGAIVWEGIVG